MKLPDASEEVSVQREWEGEGASSFEKLPSACAEGVNVTTSYADDRVHACARGLS